MNVNVKYLPASKDQSKSVTPTVQFFFIGIGRVALDVRLGCLDPNLPTDSEPQKIIDAAKYALRNVAILELKAPFWRYVPTPLWTRYVKNMDYFIQ